MMFFFPILLFFITLFLDPSSSSSSSFVDYYSLKLPLLHITPYPPPPSQILTSDSRRLSTLHRHPRLPLTSGAVTGSGQYFVTLHLGTPPQPLFLVADTGSDLTWVTCSACRGKCSTRGGAARKFFPRHSSTFFPYHCYDPSCELVPHPTSPRIPCNRTRLHSTCRYEYSYSDGSLTNGFFSRETITFNTSSGHQVNFKHLSFGCGFKISGPSVSGPSFNGAQGVMGLGNGPISFSNQLGRRFGNKFSYCLMDYTISPPPTSYLLIGGGGSRDVANMSYTPLVTNQLSPTFYYIGIEEVLVDNVKLQISPSVWAIDELGNGGTIVDSGTTLTFLAEPAYVRVLAEFRRLVKLPKPAESTVGFDLCVNISGVNTGASLPRLSFKFVGGSVFAPPPSNYFIDTAEDIQCLAIQPAARSGFSVIGNLMQQGFVLEFDKSQSRLGFSRHGCGLP